MGEKTYAHYIRIFLIVANNREILYDMRSSTINTGVTKAVEYSNDFDVLTKMILLLRCNFVII